MIEAFPLYWPEGWPRTKWRGEAKYKVRFGVARGHLLNGLKLMRASGVVISSNLSTRGDGLPYADAPKRLADPGIAVYFTRGKEQQVIACDKWNSPAANLRAIGLTVEALRGISRAGATEMLDRAFTGFKALPPKGKPMSCGHHQGCLVPTNDPVGGTVYCVACVAYEKGKTDGAETRWTP